MHIHISFLSQILSPFFFFFFGLTTPCGMWDPSSLTRDWEYKILTTGPPGKSLKFFSHFSVFNVTKAFYFILLFFIDI